MRADIAQLIGYESASSIIRNFQPTVIPGLLQTEEYATAMLPNLIPQLAEQELKDVVEIRMKRQQLQQRPDAPLLFFLLDETVIRRHVGGRQMMRRQIQRLLDESDKPTVTIEIVPFSAGAHPGMRGPFVLLEFPDATDDILCLETLDGNRFIRDGEEIGRHQRTYEALRRLSSGSQGTVDQLRLLLNDLD